MPALVLKNLSEISKSNHYHQKSKLLNNYVIYHRIKQIVYHLEQTSCHLRKMKGKRYAYYQCKMK